MVVTNDMPVKQRKQFPASSSNMANKCLLLTAIHQSISWRSEWQI